MQLERPEIRSRYQRHRRHLHHHLHHHHHHHQQQQQPQQPQHCHRQGFAFLPWCDGFHLLLCIRHFLFCRLLAGSSATPFPPWSCHREETSSENICSFLLPTSSPPLSSPSLPYCSLPSSPPSPLPPPPAPSSCPLLPAHLSRSINNVSAMEMLPAARWRSLLAASLSTQATPRPVASMTARAQ
eukprot:747661-Hanusia_phi.AAC.2